MRPPSFPASSVLSSEVRKQFLNPSSPNPSLARMKSSALLCCLCLLHPAHGFVSLVTTSNWKRHAERGLRMGHLQPTDEEARRLKSPATIIPSDAYNNVFPLRRAEGIYTPEELGLAEAVAMDAASTAVIPHNRLVDALSVLRQEKRRQLREEKRKGTEAMALRDLTQLEGRYHMVFCSGRTMSNFQKEIQGYLEEGNDFVLGIAADPATELTLVTNAGLVPKALRGPYEYMPSQMLIRATMEQAWVGQMPIIKVLAQQVFNLFKSTLELDVVMHKDSVLVLHYCFEKDEGYMLFNGIKAGGQDEEEIPQWKKDQMELQRQRETREIGNLASFVEYLEDNSMMLYVLLAGPVIWNYVMAALPTFHWKLLAASSALDQIVNNV
ncbi:unnamed protein product [Chrysoparadoxa australica]